MTLPAFEQSRLFQWTPSLPDGNSKTIVIFHYVGYVRSKHPILSKGFSGFSLKIFFWKTENSNPDSQPADGNFFCLSFGFSLFPF